MENYQFTQLINEPNRVTEKNNTLIDHILTTIPEKVRCTKVAKIGISDDFPTIAVFKDSFGNKHTHQFNIDVIKTLMMINFSMILKMHHGRK